MAVYTHNVDPAAVLARYPTLDSARVGPTTTGINEVLIEALIIEAAGSLNAVLRRHAMDPAALDEDAEELVRGGIIAYAIAGCMAKMQKLEQAAAWQAKYDAVRRTIRDMPEDLGTSQSAEVAVPTSIPDDPTPTGEDRWSSQEGSTWSGW